MMLGIAFQPRTEVIRAVWLEDSARTERIGPAGRRRRRRPAALIEAAQTQSQVTSAHAEHPGRGGPNTESGYIGPRRAPRLT